MKPELRLTPDQLPRAWCTMGKGPCNEDCYGSECALRLSHVPWPEASPEQSVWFNLAEILLGLVFLGAGVAAVFS